MRRPTLLATLALLCLTPLARATNFAVLLGSSSGGKTDASLSFDFKTPDLAITGLTVSFDPADLPPDATLLLDTDPALPPGTPSLAGSFPFSLSLQDNSDGHLLHQFSHPVQLNFAVTNSPKVSDFGLSRLLETTSPPAWTLQDANLTTKDDNGNHYLCGTTDHLSDFALTPLTSLPEPAAIAFLLLLPAAATTLRPRRARP